MRLSLSDWFDRQADRLFILPAVLILLTFSIFPLLISAYLALSRFQLVAGGYQLKYVGWLNFKKLLFGGEQYHFLGVFVAIPWLGWVFLAITVTLMARSLLHYLRHGKPSLFGLTGRLIMTAAVITLIVILVTTIGPGGRLGRLSVTVIYVTIG